MQPSYVFQIVHEEQVSTANLGAQDNELWRLVKSDREQCGTLLAACVGLVALLAGLVEPYMPSITAKVSSRAACCPVYLAAVRFGISASPVSLAGRRHLYRRDGILERDEYFRQLRGTCVTTVLEVKT